MALIQFVRNHNDESTERGFQFEFYCDRCGTGCRTRFKQSTTGLVSGALEAASSVLGGLFSTAADLGSRVHSAAWEQAHDDAFVEAVAEARPFFVQCPRCSSWVCRKSCWNVKRGLCKECAPDLGVEMSAAQASRSVEEVWAHAAMADEDRKLSSEHWQETIRASCPECQAPLASNSKFCPECGAKLKGAKFCAQCGAAWPASAKFCPECGAKG